MLQPQARVSPASLDAYGAPQLPRIPGGSMTLLNGDVVAVHAGVVPAAVVGPLPPPCFAFLPYSFGSFLVIGVAFSNRLSIPELRMSTPPLEVVGPHSMPQKSFPSAIIDVNGEPQLPRVEGGIMALPNGMVVAVHAGVVPIGVVESRPIPPGVIILPYSRDFVLMIGSAFSSRLPIPEPRMPMLLPPEAAASHPEELLAQLEGALNTEAAAAAGPQEEAVDRVIAEPERLAEALLPEQSVSVMPQPHGNGFLVRKIPGSPHSIWVNLSRKYDSEDWKFTDTIQQSLDQMTQEGSWKWISSREVQVLHGYRITERKVCIRSGGVQNPVFSMTFRRSRYSREIPITEEEKAIFHDVQTKVYKIFRSRAKGESPYSA